VEQLQSLQGEPETAPNFERPLKFLDQACIGRVL
jgi:hypothetical protein